MPASENEFPLRVRNAFLLLLPHRVNGLVHEMDDMEPVEADGGIEEVSSDDGCILRAHVHRGCLDAIQDGFASLKPAADIHRLR